MSIVTREQAVPAAAPGAVRTGAAAPLSERERRLLLAIVEAALPAGGMLEGGGPRTLARFERWLDEIPHRTARGLRAAYFTLEASTLPTRGRPFSRLSLEARMEVLLHWEQSRLFTARALLRALLTPLKHAHFDRPEMFAHVGCRYELDTVRDEKPRWLGQVTDGREVSEDLTLECEVVVIGTGAGGAAAAYELASRGRAVLLLEEGDYHRRGAFRGVASWANHAMYRDQGMTIALGNVGIPIFAGRAVGGSTVINSGTCYPRARAHLRPVALSASAWAPSSRPRGSPPSTSASSRCSRSPPPRRPTWGASAPSSPAAPSASASGTASSPATRPTATDRASAASAAPPAPSAPPTSATCPRRWSAGRSSSRPPTSTPSTWWPGAPAG